MKDIIVRNCEINDILEHGTVPVSSLEEAENYFFGFCITSTLCKVRQVTERLNLCGLTEKDCLQADKMHSCRPNRRIRALKISVSLLELHVP